MSCDNSMFLNLRDSLSIDYTCCDWFFTSILRLKALRTSSRIGRKYYEHFMAKRVYHTVDQITAKLSQKLSIFVAGKEDQFK